MTVLNVNNYDATLYQDNEVMIVIPHSYITRVNDLCANPKNFNVFLTTAELRELLELSESKENKDSLK